MNKLTILICSLPERKQKLQRLLNLLPETNNYEKLISLKDRQTPTGTKRNELIKSCGTEYFCFVDDDDLVTKDYIPEILNAIESNPDVVTFNGWMTTNNANRVDWEIKLGEKYEERNGKYYRFPNHLCVFKKSLVEHIKFPDIWIGEDYIWAKKIRDLGILKKEVHIPKLIYHYDYWSKK